MYKILDGNSKYFDNKKLKFKPTAQNFCIPLLAVRVITKTQNGVIWINWPHIVSLNCYFLAWKNIKTEVTY